MGVHALIIPIIKIKPGKLDKAVDCDFLIRLNKDYFTPYYAVNFLSNYSVSDTDLYLVYLNYKKYLKKKMWRYFDIVSFSDVGVKVSGLKPLTVKLLMALQKYFLGVLNNESSKFLDKYLPVKEYNNYIIEYLTDFTTFFINNNNKVVKILTNNNFSLYVTEKSLSLTSILRTYLVDSDKAWPIPVIISSDVDKSYVYSLSGNLLLVLNRDTGIKNMIKGKTGVKYIEPSELVKIQDDIIDNNVRMYNNLTDKYLYTSGFVIHPDKSVSVLFSVTSDEGMVTPEFSNSVSFIGYNHEFYIVRFDSNIISEFQPVGDKYVLMYVKNEVKPIALSVYKKEYDKFLIFVRRMYGNKFSG